MRLDMDCVRDILFCVELHASFNCGVLFVAPDVVPWYVDDDEEDLSPRYYQERLAQKYTDEEILYHVLYCVEANLLSCREITAKKQGFVKVTDLTVAGHELLDNIRSESTWSKLQYALAKTGGASLEVVGTVAREIATAAINRYINL